MPNECSISITRGRNKGKLCRDVNRTCRHKDILCPNCGEEFSYKHTYTAHARLCSQPQSEDIPLKRTVKVRDRIKGSEEILARIHTLEQQNRDLKDKVQKVADQPRNINNIVVIGNDFFQELTAKIGKDRTVEFLSSTAAIGKPIDVIEKLYLEGKDPMHYPIACRDDDHFRYLSHDDKGGRKLVDDRGGAIIGDIMMNRLRNAFLMAANELISKHIQDGFDGLEGNVDVLRCVQNIATVDKNMVVYQLAEATNNSNHPFFLAEGECEKATSNTKVQL
jgi:hypothetical protein